MSTRYQLVVLAALATLQIFQCFDIDHVIRYTQDVLRYRSAASSGIFNFWIYQTYREVVVEKLASSIDLATIPRMILTSATQPLPEIFRMPSFMLISLSSRVTSLYKVVNHSDTHTPVFAFCREDSPQAIQQMIRLLSGYGLSNALLIPLTRNNHQVRRVHPVAKRIERIESLPPIDGLFPDALRDLRRRRIHFVIQQDSHRARLSPDGRIFSGRTAIWIITTLMHMNASLAITRSVCPPGQDHQICMYNEKMKNAHDKKIMVNSFPESFTTSNMLISGIPTSLALLAPNGRVLSDLEIFVKPYEPEVWLTLIAVVMICSIVQRIFFRNLESNLVLATICGFERGEFHRTTGVMTMVFTGLAFYSFFMLESYSAKIISLMMDKPFTHVPRVITDFRRFGIRATTTSSVHEATLADTRQSALYGLLDYNPFWVFQPCEMKYGIVAEDDVARLYVEQEAFCKRKYSRHHILGQSLGMVLDQYQFGQWNPLKVVFQRSERKLFEGGFFGMWTTNYERSVVEDYRMRIGNPGEDDTMLDLSDLGVSFLVLGVGMFLSLVTFFTERRVGLIGRGSA